jgi:16S rRNA (adenine1518-N6/adenine1519-N6)-dimethyltransferase
MNLLESDLPFRQMLLTVQKEVAQRLLARPEDENYSAVSVLVHLLAKTKWIREVRPDVFWPRPNVSSAVVRLLPLNTQLPSTPTYQLLKELASTAFAQPRKKMKKSLRATLQRLKIRPEHNKELTPYLEQRPEMLSPTDFVKLTQLVSSLSPPR